MFLNKSLFRSAKTIGTVAGLCLALLLPIHPHSFAAELTSTGGVYSAIEYIDISTTEELQNMALNPTGAYRLTTNLDLAGIEWVPFSFHGILDGNGYSLLNLTVIETGDAIMDSYDGNMKVYETCFAGMFDVLSDASILNLNLVGVNVEVTSDQPVFIGSFAGYMEKSTISNCTVSGRLSLKAHDRQFGVGGVIGYGNGRIESVDADVTLICIDTDATTRDEQFMGGICATGYPDVDYCNVKIAGYDSEHGYVHNGGLIGMYMFSPQGTVYQGSITHNTITGKITFFEDNTKRRAYCKDTVGEIVNWDFTNGWNTSDFVRDERYEYTRDLLPHDCENETLREEITEPGCDTFGYTTLICDVCGYTEVVNYTLEKHTLTNWVTVTPAAVGVEGLEECKCEYCEYTETRALAALEPEPTPAPTAKPEVTDPTPEPAATRTPITRANGNKGMILALLPIFGILIGLYMIIHLVLSIRRKFGRN